MTKFKWGKKHLAELKVLNEREEQELNDAQQAIDELVSALSPNIMSVEEVDELQYALTDARCALERAALTLHEVENARIRLRMRAKDAHRQRVRVARKNAQHVFQS